MTTLVHNEQRNFDKAFWSLITKGSYVKGEVTELSVRSTMQHYLSRLHVDLSSLKVIHVAGSKGKGSTCVQTEALLRARGLRTGLFTSPHLIDVRERFRMDGKPIVQSSFLQHFWYVWDTLHKEEDQAALPNILRTDSTYRSVPGFFRFMTCLAFRIFTAENVDVAVIEVGIGGRLDATNVVSCPIVCGISLLDLDHTQILGNTLPQIAREKAGIMKPSVPCFTVRQTTSAYDVLIARANHVGCELSTPVHLRTLDMIQANAYSPSSPTIAAASTRISVKLSYNGGNDNNSGGSSNSNNDNNDNNDDNDNDDNDDNDDNNEKVLTTSTSIKRDRSHSNTLKDQFQLGLAGQHQETNASLALSLSRCYLRVCMPTQYGNGRLGPRAPLNELEIRALEQCTWPGRGQTVTLDMLHDDVAKALFGANMQSSEHGRGVTLRLDGAHTRKSIESCMQWYLDVTTADTPARQQKRVLIFNCSHERNVGQLLKILHDGCAFDSVIFCPADVGRPSRLPLPTMKEVASNMGVDVVERAMDENGDRDEDENQDVEETKKEKQEEPKWQRIMCDAWNQLRLKQLRVVRKEGVDAQKFRGSNNQLSGGWAHVCSSIDNAMSMLRKQDDVGDDNDIVSTSRKGSSGNNDACQVLVTGSLYLVGGVLSRCGWDPDSGFEK